MKYYRTQHYVPYRVVWIIPLAWAIFQSFQSERYIVASLIGLSCILIWTTHYGIGINETEKKYTDYLWIFGLRKGQTKTFDNIEYLFVNKNKVTQRGYFTSLSYSFQRDKYDGYMKFDETNKIHLATKDNKKGMMKVLNRIAGDLKIEVVDYSRDEK
jgi:hypothetical protein